MENFFPDTFFAGDDQEDLHLKKNRVVIEGVRPKDDNDHYGYRRISAFVAGWRETPRLRRNY